MELSTVEQIQKRGVLRVASLTDLAFFHEQQDSIQAFDYEFASQFAEELGVKLVFESSPSFDKIVQKLKQGHIDLATAMPVTKAHKQRLHFSPSYLTVTPTIVYRQGSAAPVIGAKEQQIYIGKHSHYSNVLTEISTPLNWHLHQEHSTATLFKHLLAGTINYVLVNDTTFSHYQQLYPKKTQGYALAEKNALAWAVKQTSDPSLWAKMIAFFGNHHHNGALISLNQKHLHYSHAFNYPGIDTFLRKVNTRLPRYIDLFKRHAGDLDWRLLAAISYQESHWDPHARSPTGVRGLMMLTRPTAKALGVVNRIDPEQSVRGGSRFLHQLLNRIPESIAPQERIWFALAAYNMGYGHMMDARKITQIRGQNPDIWTHVNNNLHLLHQRKWYNKTRYGFARGLQARTYVANIRMYYQSLQHRLPSIRQG